MAAVVKDGSFSLTEPSNLDGSIRIKHPEISDRQHKVQAERS